MCVSNSDVLLGGRPSGPKLNLNSVRLITELVDDDFPGEMEWGPSLACIQKAGEGVFHLAIAEAGEGRGGGGEADEE